MAAHRWPYEMFGVQCSEGWKSLYEPLLELCKLYNIPVLQVKEKFCGLRFYTGAMDTKIDTLIAAAEHYSYKVCEDCGATGMDYIESAGFVNRVTTGESRTSTWLRSLCAPCREKWDTARESIGNKKELAASNDRTGD